MNDSQQLALSALRDELIVSMKKCAEYPNASTSNRNLWNIFNEVLVAIDYVIVQK